MEGEKVATVKNHWMLAREAATRRMEAKAGRAPKPAHTPQPVTFLFRVNDRNPAHTRFSVFAGRNVGSRGHAGELTMRTDEFDEFERIFKGSSTLAGLNPDAVPGLVEAAQALLEALRWHFVPAIEENINSPMAHAKDREIDALRAALAKVREG